MIVLPLLLDFTNTINIKFVQLCCFTEAEGVETDVNADILSDDQKVFRGWETSEATTLLPFHIQRVINNII